MDARATLAFVRAMLLHHAREPLELADVPEPETRDGQLKINVEVCAVCRTDLHVVDGELPHARLPLIPGHEIVGTVAEVGTGVSAFAVGSPSANSDCE